MGTRDKDSWKSKMGVELSGLEGTRDFLVAIGLIAVVVIVGMLIAFIAFG